MSIKTDLEQLHDRPIINKGLPSRVVRSPADMRKIEILERRLQEACEHINALCMADWAAGDNAESDAAQAFVRDSMGRYPAIRK